MILYSFALVSLLGVISCDRGTPCCIPNQWSGNLVQTIGDYNTQQDAAFLAYGNADVFYDYTGKQLGYRQKLDNQTAHVKTNTWGILKYKEGKKYEIRDDQCTVTELQTAMIAPCIPDNAAFFGTHSYPAGVLVDYWFIDDTPNKGGFRRVGVSHDTCMPMTMSHLSTGPDYVLGMHLFQNVTKGITDPTVFVVPAICNPQLTHKSISNMLKLHMADRQNVVSMEQDDE